MSKISVLFVCLGNICRSPVAEGVFRAKLAELGLENGFDVDSAGTAAWHAGKPPDNRMIKVAANKGVDISGLRARQVTMDDFHQFDFILAMDHENLRNLEEIDPGIGKAQLGLYLEYAPGYQDKEVPDPYYGGDEGFSTVINMVEDAAEGLIKSLQNLNQ